MTYKKEYLNLSSSNNHEQTYGPRVCHFNLITISGLVCPSRTSEHGGEGYCVKGGGGGEGESKKECVLWVP